MKKILYLECLSGISGDMTVGALLDLGADREVLEKALESLGVGGYHLHFGRTKKCGIDAYDFDVQLEEEHGGEAGHEHVHESGGGEDGHSHVHEHGCGEDGHGHVHEHSCGSEAEHTHDHVHGHEPGHVHSHVHRNIHDIYQIISRLAAGEPVKEKARQMFDIVARAEAQAHGIPLAEVHFHEVGAIDSIVDIISVAVCMDNLGIEKVVVSPLAEGTGYVHCQHGVIPVPVPATVNIASANGLSLRLTDNDGEMVTPTGAAIAAAYNSGEALPRDYRIAKIGLGAGKKEFKQANILRAMLIEEAAETADRLWKLETNIDDSSGEALGYAMEELLKQGAADVWYTPVYMKKNRPAYQLNLLCREDRLAAMETILFTHTTTIGIRRYQVERTVLDRSAETVDTPWGKALVKVCRYKGRVYCYPEYESVSQICRQTGISYGQIYQQTAAAAMEQLTKEQ